MTNPTLTARFAGDANDIEALRTELAVTNSNFNLIIFRQLLDDRFDSVDPSDREHVDALIGPRHGPANQTGQAIDVTESSRESLTLTLHGTGAWTKDVVCVAALFSLEVIVDISDGPEDSCGTFAVQF